MFGSTSKVRNHLSCFYKDRVESKFETFEFGIVIVVITKLFDCNCGISKMIVHFCTELLFAHTLRHRKFIICVFVLLKFERLFSKLLMVYKMLLKCIKLY